MRSPKQFLIPDDISKRINSLQFILIVLIVIHHTFFDFYYKFLCTPEPIYVEKIRILFTDIVVKVAVPLFFIISSFFLYSKENSFVTVLKKKSRTVLLPYILWNFLYILWVFIVQNNPIRELSTPPEYCLINYSPLDWLQAFLGDFSHSQSLERFPFNYPLWFLRDLFILNLFFIPIKKIIDKFPFAVLMLAILLWVSGIQLWVVAPRSLLFFMLGYYIVKYNNTVNLVDKIRFRDVGLIYVLSVFLELFFKNKFIAIDKINVIIGIIFFAKGSLYLIKDKKFYNSLMWLGKYRFIIYTSHVIIIPYAIRIMVILIPMNGAFLLLKYFGAVILTILLCIMLGIILNKLMPRFYRILTGGRSKKQNAPALDTKIYTPALSPAQAISPKDD